MFGGMVDTVMMRIVDIISTIPLTLYVILISEVMGDDSSSIVIALSSVYWVDMARVVRGQVLTLKGQEFVFAARTIGTSRKDYPAAPPDPQRHGADFGHGDHADPPAIFMEAFLSFIGLGVAPPWPPGHHVQRRLGRCAPPPTSCFCRRWSSVSPCSASTSWGTACGTPWIPN